MQIKYSNIAQSHHGGKKRPDKRNETSAGKKKKHTPTPVQRVFEGAGQVSADSQHNALSPTKIAPGMLGAICIIMHQNGLLRPALMHEEP